MRTISRRTTDGFSIHRLWRGVSRALVMVGFLSLAFTGEIHPVLVSLFVGLWAWGSFVGRTPGWWRPWMERVVVVVALVGIVLGILLLKFTGLLFLLLFLVLYKNLTLKEPKDYLQLHLLSFFMFLSCSVITQNPFYVVFLFLFVMLSIVGLVCYSVVAEARRSVASAGLRTDVDEFTKLPHLTLERGILRRIWGGSLSLTVVVCVLGTGLFLVIPHRAEQAFDSQWIPRYTGSGEQAMVAGYEDEVSLRQVDRIASDDTVVLMARLGWAGQTSPSRPLPATLRLRGTALEDYQVEGWTMRRMGGRLRSALWTQVPLPDLVAQTDWTLEQRITQNLEATGRLFGAPNPLMFDLANKHDLSVEVDWPKGVRVTNGRVPMAQAEPLRYNVTSHYTEEATRLLFSLHREGRRGDPRYRERPRTADSLLGEMPRQQYPVDPILRRDELWMNPYERQVNTELPRTRWMDRMRREAERIATAPDEAGQILQLLEYFRREFEYTVHPRIGSGEHPMAEFLFQARRGHCEYFATGMALMLRAKGIPARIATGFYTSERDPNEPIFTVRQNDAHAWVEAWMDGLGWLTLDPTPPDMRGRAALLDVENKPLERFRQTLRATWQTYVVDYSYYKQHQLYNWLLDGPAGASLRRWARGWTDPWGRSSPQGRAQPGGARTWITLVGGAVLLGVLFGVVRFGLLAWNRPQGRAGLSMRKGRSPLPLVNRLLKRLARQGWPRPPGQAVGEFLAEVDRRTNGRWSLSAVIEVYYPWRFAGRPPSREQLERTAHIVNHIR